MQIDAGHESFKNIAPLISRLNKKTEAEDEPNPVGKCLLDFQEIVYCSF